MKKMVLFMLTALLLTGCSFEVQDADSDKEKFKIEIENTDDE